MEVCDLQEVASLTFHLTEAFTKSYLPLVFLKKVSREDWPNSTFLNSALQLLVFGVNKFHTNLSFHFLFLNS